MGDAENVSYWTGSIARAAHTMGYRLEHCSARREPRLVYCLADDRFPRPRGAMAHRAGRLSERAPVRVFSLRTHSYADLFPDLRRRDNLRDAFPALKAPTPKPPAHPQRRTSQAKHGRLFWPIAVWARTTTCL